MYTHTNVAMITRTEDLLARGKAERLRRAGYRDGERRPRQGHHWANLGAARMAVRRLRAR